MYLVTFHHWPQHNVATRHQNLFSPLCPQRSELPKHWNPGAWNKVQVAFRTTTKRDCSPLYRTQYHPSWTQQPVFTLQPPDSQFPGRRTAFWTSNTGSSPFALTHFKCFDVKGKIAILSTTCVSMCVYVCVSVGEFVCVGVFVYLRLIWATPVRLKSPYF